MDCFKAHGKCNMFLLKAEQIPHPYALVTADNIASKNQGVPLQNQGYIENSFL